MGGVPSYLAVLIEAGAVTKKNETSDARMIRYSTSNYPDNVGVEMVVTDLEDFRLISSLVEPRLALYLQELAINLDCGLATKNSEGSKMLGRLQGERQIAVSKANTEQNSLDEMNYSQSKADIGNKKY